MSFVFDNSNKYSSKECRVDSVYIYIYANWSHLFFLCRKNNSLTETILLICFLKTALVLWKSNKTQPRNVVNQLTTVLLNESVSIEFCWDPLWNWGLWGTALVGSVNKTLFLPWLTAVDSVSLCHSLLSLYLCLCPLFSTFLSLLHLDSLSLTLSFSLSQFLSVSLFLYFFITAASKFEIFKD